MVAAKINGVPSPAIEDRYEKHTDWNLILEDFGVSDEYLFQRTDYPVTIVSRVDEEPWKTAKTPFGNLPIIWPRRLFENRHEGEVITLQLKKGKSIKLQIRNIECPQVIPKTLAGYVAKATDMEPEAITYKEVSMQDILRYIRR